MGQTKATDGAVKQVWRLIDVGNTHIKTASTTDGTVGEVRLLPTTARPDQHDVKFELDAKLAAIACVNPAALATAIQLAEAGGTDVRVLLKSDGTIFQSGLVTTDVKTPETTGVDRVLACLGAISVAPDRNVIVVDCGTATTVNVMTADRCFRGGMIFPGQRMLAASLHKGTAALPEVVPVDPHISVGKSTREALESGVAAALLGGIDRAVRTALDEFPDASVFITGGDAEFVGRAFPRFQRKDWLTLLGLHWYAVHASAGP